MVVQRVCFQKVWLLNWMAYSKWNMAPFLPLHLLVLHAGIASQVWGLVMLLATLGNIGSFTGRETRDVLAVRIIEHGISWNSASMILLQFHHLLVETCELSILPIRKTKQLAEGTVCYSFEVLLDNASKKQIRTRRECPSAHKKGRLACSGLPWPLGELTILQSTALTASNLSQPWQSLSQILPRDRSGVVAVKAIATAGQV